MNKWRNASLCRVCSLLTTAPLWLVLAAASTSVHAQAHENVSRSSTSLTPEDWTQFHRDNMQRWNPYETALDVNNVHKLQLKWSHREGLPSDDATFTSPAVANGVVYISEYDGVLYALNASTGEGLWRNSAVAAGSTPAVANGMVYVGGLDGNVYGVNASSGAVIWSYSTFGYLESAPAVANGVVYIASTDARVYALNAQTGALLWSYLTETPSPPDYSVALFSSCAVVNGAVYIGTANGDVLALNANTGAKLWSYTAGNYVYSSPAVANGTVYVGSYDGNVYALNANTGAKLWSYDTGVFVSSSPAVANGVVYVADSAGTVYALNANTGARLWRYNTGGDVDSPAVANGVVYIGSTDGHLYALSASTGVRLWSYNTGVSSYNIVSEPDIVDGVVYLHSAGPFGLDVDAFALGDTADLFLRIRPNLTTVYQGDLLTYAFPVWNLGPGVAKGEVLTNLQVPAGTTFDYVRISGTPGLGTCTHPPYQGTGQIVCHQNASMAPNTTWTVRLTVKVTAPTGTVITENAATMSDTPDPNMANNTATVSLTVQ